MIINSESVTIKVIEDNSKPTSVEVINVRHIFLSQSDLLSEVDSMLETKYGKGWHIGIIFSDGTLIACEESLAKEIKADCNQLIEHIEK